MSEWLRNIVLQTHEPHFLSAVVSISRYMILGIDFCQCLFRQETFVCVSECVRMVGQLVVAGSLNWFAARLSEFQMCP